MANAAAAETNASRLLRNAQVAARVAELKASAAKASNVTAARVLDELAKLAFANMADYMRVGAGGDPVLDFSKLTRDQAAALTEVTVEDYLDGRGEDAREVRKVKFKLADKRGPLVDLGKHLGLFKERIEHSGPDGGPIETREALPPMTPPEVAAAVQALIAGAEVEMGMPPGRGRAGPRLKAIIDSGEPLSPNLYEVIYGGRTRDD